MCFKDLIEFFRENKLLSLLLFWLGGVVFANCIYFVHLDFESCFNDLVSYVLLDSFILSSFTDMKVVVFNILFKKLCFKFALFFSWQKVRRFCFPSWGVLCLFICSLILYHIIFYIK